MASVLLVGHEPAARRGIGRLLRARRDVTVVGECEAGPAAAKLIERHRPDLVLLEVQKAGADALDVAHVAPAQAPVLIVVAGSAEYASRAFELGAVDFVVKPFADERLMRAVDRGLTRRAERAAALSQLVASGRYRQRFLVGIGPRDIVVPVSEIAWIRASGYYASLVTHDRKEYLVRTPLDRLEEELDPATFIRTHRSAIVALAAVRGTERTGRRGGGLAALLRDGTRVPVSRSRREAVLRALGATT